MRQFVCPYVSDGRRYTATIWAKNRDDASRRMREIAWGIDSGPSGQPSPLRRQPQPVQIVVLLLIAAGILATSTNFLDRELRKIETAAHSSGHHRLV